MKARPIQNRIFVRVDAPEARLKSGLWIPQKGQRPKRMGVILAVGPGMYDNSGKFVKTKLTEGTRVIFGAYAGTEITIDEEKVRVMRETDVVAAFEGDSDAIETAPLESRRENISRFYQ